uniref:Uncharacterized protein n=1 Tax=Arundo donax TaxID=35708 RepID=A0A0A9D1N4_ARUDO
MSYHDTLHIYQLLSTSDFISSFLACIFHRFITQDSYTIFFSSFSPLQVVSLLVTAVNNLVTGELM